MKALLKPLNHRPTAVRTIAERAFSARLNGGCSAPIAAFARVDGDRVEMSARVISLDGASLLHASKSAVLNDAQKLGTQLAIDLLEQGAQEILDNADHALIA